MLTAVGIMKLAATRSARNGGRRPSIPACGTAPCPGHADTPGCLQYRVKMEAPCGPVVLPRHRLSFYSLAVLTSQGSAKGKRKALQQSHAARYSWVCVSIQLAAIEPGWTWLLPFKRLFPPACDLNDKSDVLGTENLFFGACMYHIRLILVRCC